jgi:hypothetical protein
VGGPAGEGLPAFTNNVSQAVCVVVEDASRVTVSVFFRSGSLVPAPTEVAGWGTLCVTLPTSAEGNWSFTVSAVDAAGNPSLPVSGWTVLDTSPPVTQAAAIRALDRVCAINNGLTVCSAADAVSINVTCRPESSALASARCGPEWALLVLPYTLTSDCEVTDTTSPPPSPWTPLPAPDAGVVAVGASIAGARQADVDLQVVWFSRGRDTAGNVEPAPTRLLW